MANLLPVRFRTEEEAATHLQDMKRGDVLPAPHPNQYTAAALREPA